MARNDHIQSITHQQLLKTSPEIMERMVNLYVTSQKSKFYVAEADIEKSSNISRELFASKSKEIFDEFHTLKRNLAYRFAQITADNVLFQCSQGAVQQLASPSVYPVCHCLGQQRERPSRPTQIWWNIRPAL